MEQLCKDFKFVLAAEVIIVHANYYKGVKNPDLPMGKIFIHIIVTLTDTGPSKTNYRHLLLVNSSSENFEKCCCTFRLIWN